MTTETPAAITVVPSPMTLLRQGIPLTLLLDLFRVPDADELRVESDGWRAIA